MQVDDLVRRLVSPRPARFPNGFWGPETFGRDADSFIAPEVEHAIKALRDLGPSIFTNLVTHLRDDRYSYSIEVAAWLNQTVGDAIMDQIFADGYTMHSGHKGRETPSSANVTYLDFADWVKEIGEEKWANWASSKTRLQIQMSFIDWCVEKETKRGFINDKQRTDLLNGYERARMEMTKLYGQSTSR